MAQMTRNTNSSNFQPAPEGTHLGALVDIVDVGWKEVTFEGRSQGLKPHIQLVFAINELNDEGKPFLVFDRRVKLSFDQKSTLYKRLAGWIGQATLEAMLDAGADMDDLIGRNAMISVEHREWQGSIFANVANVVAPPKGMSAFSVDKEDYTRRCERPDWDEKAPVYSSFEFLPEGVTIGSDGQPVPPDANPNSNSAQAARLSTPAPVTPNAPPVREPSPIEVTGATEAQTEELMDLASQQWGPKWATELKTFLGKHYGTLSADECAKAISDVRDMKVSASAVTATSGTKSKKAAPVATEVEDDTQADIFDDVAA